MGVVDAFNAATAQLPMGEQSPVCGVPSYAASQRTARGAGGSPDWSVYELSLWGPSRGT